MRPTLFVILSLLACALAQQTGYPLAGWSGTTTGAFTYTQPNNSVTAPYVAFNYTFATTGVREVAAIAGESTDEESWDLYVYIYTGAFNPLAPYPYFRKLGYQNGAYDEGYGPQVDDFVTFTAGTNYWFVVTGEEDEEYGDFAVNIFESITTGSNAASALWGGIEWDSSDFSCNDDDDSAPYARFTWVQNTTGRFDIIAGFDYNATYNDGDDDWDTVLALFIGNVPNSNITSSPCESGVINGAEFVDDDRSNSILGAYLTQGTTYTVVFSGDETDAVSNYGFQIIPTRIAVVYNPSGVEDTGFKQPVYELPCAPDTEATGAPWYAFSFTAVANQGPIIIAGNLDFSSSVNYTEFDTEFFIYAGSNVGSGTTPPTTCGPSGLVTYGDVFATVATPTAASVYSVVVSSYEYASHDGEPIAAGVWVFTGTYVSNSAATLATTTTTTTTASGTASSGTGATGTTGTGATGTTGTGATGTSGSSSGTNGNTTAGATTTSGAVSVCVSFVVLALSFFALML